MRAPARRARLRRAGRAQRGEAARERGCRAALPVVVGGGVLAEAAHRWKTQVNENSKCWAFWEELPELDHNSVVGFGLPQALVRAAARRCSLLPEALARARATSATKRRPTSCRAPASRTSGSMCAGESPLAQVLSAIYLGDFVSYYLALLNGVDPSPVDPIATLKARLAKG